MKNIVPAILMFCLSFSANAQKIPLDSFYLPGTTWTEAVYTYLDTRLPNFHGAECKVFRIERDTMVSGISCHVLSKMNAGDYTYHTALIGSDFVTTFSTSPPTNFYEVIGRIRVDSSKVYFTRDINTIEYTIFGSNFALGVEYLIYNFNLHVGSSIPNSTPPTGPAIFVNNIDSVMLLPGRYASKYTDYSGPGKYWMEGIGGSQGFLGAYQNLFRPESTNYRKNFTLCYDNPSLSISYQFSFADSILIGNLQRNCFDLGKLAINELKLIDDYSIYPNPTTDDFVSIEGLERVAQVTVCDITGSIMSLLQQPFAPGKAQVPIPHEPGVYIVRFEFEDGNIIIRRVSKL